MRRLQRPRRRNATPPRPRGPGRSPQALLRALVVQDLPQRALRSAGQQPGDPDRDRLAKPCIANGGLDRGGGRRTCARRVELALDLPPCLFPFIRRQDPDWRPRYERYNQPGDYHNGGVWPFVADSTWRPGRRRPAPAGPGEAPGADRGGPALARARAPLGVQRVAQGTDRRSLGPGLADLVGVDVSLRSRLRGGAGDALLRLDPRRLTGGLSSSKSTAWWARACPSRLMMMRREPQPTRRSASATSIAP